MAPYSAAYQVEWYAKNKDALQARRRAKYAADAELRARKIAQVAQHRERLRASKPQRPEEYNVSFSRASELLGVTVWVIRGWVQKKYIPNPYKHGKQLWFTTDQVNLMKELNVFLQNNGRVMKNSRSQLEDITNYVWSNW
jgi:hypothetical protein